MIITKFNQNDIVELAKLYAFSTKKNYATIGDYLSNYATKNLKLLPKNKLFKLKLKHLNNLKENEVIYVVRNKDKIIGTAFCKLNNQELIIDDFIIADNYRSKNFGSQLLTELTIIYPIIKLETNQNNIPAINFFKKHNFKIYNQKNQTLFFIKFSYNNTKENTMNAEEARNLCKEYKEKQLEVSLGLIYEQIKKAAQKGFDFTTCYIKDVTYTQLEALRNKDFQVQYNEKLNELRISWEIVGKPI